MRWGASKQRLLVRVLVLLALTLLFRQCYISFARSSGSLSTKPTPVAKKAIIVASLKGDDTEWLEEHLSDWDRYIYTVNDPDAKLTVTQNKGRESNAYLTFIIDNYHHLPEYMVFIHALRYQWHNEDPMYDGVPMLKNLRLPHVKEEGYANLRCTWLLGCPNEVRPRLDNKPAKDNEYSRDRVEAVYADMFRKFFPTEPVPSEIGVHCGAQFALHRAKVLERPLSDYKMYRQWLWDTPIDDSVSGRCMEYTWHMIMGKPAVHCPDAGDCFCKKFGLCNLTCTIDRCEKRYQLPKYASIPVGWPEIGPGEHGFPEKGWWE